MKGVCNITEYHLVGKTILSLSKNNQSMFIPLMLNELKDVPDVDDEKSIKSVVNKYINIVNTGDIQKTMNQRKLSEEFKNIIDK